MSKSRITQYDSEDEDELIRVQKEILKNMEKIKNEKWIKEQSKLEEATQEEIQEFLDKKLEYNESKEIETNERLRRFCFTWNNYPSDWITKIKKIKYTYIIANEEVAPTTGTPHIQGYCEFETPKRFTTLNKAVPGVKWIISKGTAEQNRKYITKCALANKLMPLEDGKPTKQGERNDIMAVKKLIDEGGDMLAVANLNFGCFVRNGRGLASYKQLLDAKEAKIKRINLTCEIIWGKTNCGKTETAIDEAMELYGDYFKVSTGNTGTWWTGYEGQKYVIIDDFRCNVPCHMMLQWLDKYPVQVPIHCGQVWLRAEKIVITSNTNPADWYHSVDENSREAFFRRFKKIEEKIKIPNYVKIEK